MFYVRSTMFIWTTWELSKVAIKAFRGGSTKASHETHALYGKSPIIVECPIVEANWKQYGKHFKTKFEKQFLFVHSVHFK